MVLRGHTAYDVFNLDGPIVLRDGLEYGHNENACNDHQHSEDVLDVEPLFVEEVEEDSGGKAGEGSEARDHSWADSDLLAEVSAQAHVHGDEIRVDAPLDDYKEGHLVEGAIFEEEYGLRTRPELASLGPHIPQRTVEMVAHGNKHQGKELRV